MDPTKTCATCACFAALPKECRAKPPIGMLIAGPNGQPANLGFFPSTKPENWCGEWRQDAPTLKGAN